MESQASDLTLDFGSKVGTVRLEAHRRDENDD